MAKYDANGRPVYETAEEYNKAHGTGSFRRTYDSPEGDAYQHNSMRETKRYQKAASRQRQSSGTKSGKKLVLGLAVFLIIMNMGVIFTMFQAVSGVYSDVDFDESYIEQDDGDELGWEEYPGEDTTPLIEGFETFYYEGEMYTLPMTFDELMNMGYALDDEYDEDDIIAAGSYEHVALNDEDRYMVVMVRIKNDTDEDMKLKDCVVEYFYIDNDAAYSEDALTPEFTFGANLDMDSTYEELEECFGLPYYHYSDHDEENGYYDSYEWVYNEGEEYHCVQVTFWNDVISNVSIEKSRY